VRKNKLFFLNEHLDRLFHSAKEINLHHNYTKKQISDWVQSLLNKEKPSACNLKILLFGGKTPEETNIYILLLSPLYPDRKLYKTGAKTITFNYERWKPGAKTLNMLPSYFYYSEAKKAGCYDCLFSNSKGFLIEGSRTNFFLIKNKTLFSPPKNEILEGVTYLTVLQTAKKQGFELKEETFKESDLKDFDGAFLTSTSSKIVPIKQINDFIFPEISEEIKFLIKKYDEFLENYS
jgi:branched-subunit amino acid aminotransferase/4-amino-4-deoxychorismate lyase